MNKKSSTPLYEQVAVALKKEICNQSIPVGSSIPTEIDLCSHYQVSRITIRKAITKLCDEGLLVKKQGLGTFVTSNITRANLPTVVSYHEQCRMQGKSPKVRVIHVRETSGTEKDWNALHLSTGSRIIESSRILFADNEAAIYEINHFSMAYMYLLESDLTNSIYHILKQYGIEPSQSTYEISMVKADPVTANLMGIPIGSPLISIFETVYDQLQRPLHTSSQLLRGDILKFRI